MAVVQIPNLPVAVGIDGREEVEIVQGGTSKRTTTQAIADLGPTFVVQSTVGYFGSFYDTTDQTSAGTTSANVVSFNATNEVKGITIFDGSKIKVSETGVYNIQFTARIKSTSVGTDLINIWIAKDGTNVVQTNSPMTILGGSNDVASWNFVLQMSANSYIQIYWSCSTSTNVTLEASPTSPDPDKPQTPSASITIQQIGRTDAGWEQPQMAPGQVLGRPAGITNGPLEEMPFSNPVDYGSFSNVLTASGTSTTANSWTPLEPHNATLYGATPDGITDNAAAFTSANSAPSIVITSGTYYVASNVTFTKPVTIEAGAIINIPNGVTVAFNGGFNAGLYKIFNCSGSGAVTFAPSYMPVGYPEWWGAITNSGSADNYASITACINACDTTELQLGDYWTSTTIKVTSSYKTLVGKGNYFSATGSCTRILINSATGITIQLGPDSNPGGGPNNFIKNITLKNVFISRSQAPLSNTNATGVLAQYVLFLTINEVRSSEHDYGFHFVGVVATKVSNCYSFRSVTNPLSVGSPKFWGYYVDGLTAPIFAGGNASIYFSDCLSSVGTYSIEDSVGFYLDGNFSDCFISDCETTTVSIGILINSNNPSALNGNVDLLITNPVIDQFVIAGIYINDTNFAGAISINGGFCAPGQNVSTDPLVNKCVAGLYFNNSRCQAMVNNFQIIAYPNVLCKGIVAVGSANIESRTQIVNMSGAGLSLGALVLSGVTNSRFMDHVTNTSYSLVGPVVQMVANCTRNYVQVFAEAQLASYTIGCQVLGTTNTYNEINCTGLDQACISGNKLQINGVNISTTGLVGTNLASGVMN